MEQEQETGPFVDPATGRKNHGGLVLTGWISGLRWGPDQSEAKATQSDSYYYPLKQILGPLGCICEFVVLACIKLATVAAFRLAAQIMILFNCKLKCVKF